MNKHTPGPWKVIEHSWSRTGIYAEQEGIAALDIYDEATEENQEELQERMEANARLIAAAPDLLANLQFAVKVLGGIPAIGGTAQVDAMRAAIAKATGQAA